MSRSRAHLVLPSSGTRVPVPDGDDFDPAIIRAEHEALAAHPEVQARAERARRNRAAGKGISAEDMDRYLAELDQQAAAAERRNGSSSASGQADGGTQATTDPSSKSDRSGRPEPVG